MLRLTLAVTLMLTQTWQAFAAPVYFCVAPDGSQGVDLGPESCACHSGPVVAEVSKPADQEQCASRGCCGGHGRDVANLEAAVVSDAMDPDSADTSAVFPADCLCKHVPVSCTSAQVVSKSRTVIRASVLSNANCPLVRSLSLVSASADWWLRPPLDDSGGMLRALKCIVLRC